MNSHLPRFQMAAKPQDPRLASECRSIARPGLDMILNTVVVTGKLEKATVQEIQEIQD
jgi:hypothetical protein